MKLLETLQFGIFELQNHSETARLDTELLLCHVLNFSRAQLITHSEKILSTSELTEFKKLLTRRRQGEPIAYILGHCEFWSLPLKVTPDVLIPRPETELVVELALKLFSAEQRIQVADLGTGSGAIALAIAHERPEWHMTATDHSQAALNIAQKNAKSLGINNIIFCLGNWCQALPSTQRFAIIVSNPPYIEAADKHLTNPGLQFEPQNALTPGRDGLQAIRLIIEQALQHLSPGGWLVLEHGYDQAEHVTKLLTAKDYSNIMTYSDLSGVPRVTLGKKMLISSP